MNVPMREHVAALQADTHSDGQLIFASSTDGRIRLRFPPKPEAAVNMWARGTKYDRSRRYVAEGTIGDHAQHGCAVPYAFK